MTLSFASEESSAADVDWLSAGEHTKYTTCRLQLHVAHKVPQAARKLSSASPQHNGRAQTNPTLLGTAIRDGQFQHPSTFYLVSTERELWAPSRCDLRTAQTEYAGFKKFKPDACGFRAAHVWTYIPFTGLSCKELIDVLAASETVYSVNRFVPMGKEHIDLVSEEIGNVYNLTKEPAVICHRKMRFGSRLERPHQSSVSLRTHSGTGTRQGSFAPNDVPQATTGCIANPR